MAPSRSPPRTQAVEHRAAAGRSRGSGVGLAAGVCAQQLPDERPGAHGRARVAAILAQRGRLSGHDEVGPVAGVVERLAYQAAMVPADVELGFHLCYGDFKHQHFMQPKDGGVLCEISNRISAAVSRPVTWIHVPVPINRTDEAYFEPFSDLSVVALQADDAACGHYRIVYPMEFLKRGGARVEVTSGLSIQMLAPFDIILAQRQYHPAIFDMLQEVRRMGKTLIYEIDDNVHAVHPSSVAYKIYKTGIVSLSYDVE